MPLSRDAYHRTGGKRRTVTISAGFVDVSYPLIFGPLSWPC